jgi:hypothetical protein
MKKEGVFKIEIVSIEIEYGKTEVLAIEGWFSFSFLPSSFRRLCFICRPSDVSEDAAMEPRTVATLTMTIYVVHPKSN